MKPRHVAALGLAIFLSSCTLFPHRESSPQVTGRVLDKNTHNPVSDASITMTGFFAASGATGPDGRFELRRIPQWMSYIPLGDPGCWLKISAVGYNDYHADTICGLPEYPWEVGTVLLVPAGPAN